MPSAVTLTPADISLGPISPSDPKETTSSSIVRSRRGASLSSIVSAPPVDNPVMTIRQRNRCFPSTFLDDGTLRVSDEFIKSAGSSRATPQTSALPTTDAANLLLRLHTPAIFVATMAHRNSPLEANATHRATLQPTVVTRPSAKSRSVLQIPASDIYQFTANKAVENLFENPLASPG